MKIYLFQLLAALYEHNDLALSLVSSISKENWSLKLYKQGNVRATRKQILPIIQSALVGCLC